ncbi:hypothetical protein GIB67_009442, partial [Kingdonia uniflora]
RRATEKETRVSLNSSSILLDIRSNKTKSRSNELRIIWSKTLESLQVVQTTRKLVRMTIAFGPNSKGLDTS